MPLAGGQRRTSARCRGLAEAVLISAVHAVRMEKVADIAIATPGREASAVDPGKELLYVNLVDDAAVAVVDLRKRRRAGGPAELSSHPPRDSGTVHLYGK